MLFRSLGHVGADDRSSESGVRHLGASSRCERVGRRGGPILALAVGTVDDRLTNRELLGALGAVEEARSCQWPGPCDRQRANGQGGAQSNAQLGVAQALPLWGSEAKHRLDST